MNLEKVEQKYIFSQSFFLFLWTNWYYLISKKIFHELYHLISLIISQIISLNIKNLSLQHDFFCGFSMCCYGLFPWKNRWMDGSTEGPQKSRSITGELAVFVDICKGWNFLPQIIGGVFHRPWNKDPYSFIKQDNSGKFFFFVGAQLRSFGIVPSMLKSFAPYT